MSLNPFFLLSPEKAHFLAKQYIQLRYSHWVCHDHSNQTVQKPIKLWNLTFPNRVGLAAGWDNNATCFDALFRMGFGFVEVGGVTPHPQAGNPKPRIFRIPQKKALINRMGFCNAGIDALVSKLQTRKMSGILGVNIAKNKNTPLENALDDYQVCLKAVYPYADYVVVNISSPNTPRLRELQSSRYLNELLQGLRIARRNAAATFHRDVPLLVKTSVDLPESDYASFIQTIMDADIDGLVISNTTLDHSSVMDCRNGNETGGLSGQPLLMYSTNMIHKISEITEKKLPMIGVGGILSGRDAVAYNEAGAQLVQVFTGFLYRGPVLIHEILQFLENVY